jgi:cell division protein FtsW
MSALRESSPYRGLDAALLLAVLALLGLGLVMVGSASITVSAEQMGGPFALVLRQSTHLVLGLLVAWGVVRIPLRAWERLGPVLLLVALLLLVLVVLPGVAPEVNGSRRWLRLGGIGFQVSELAKPVLIVYLAGFLVRRADDVLSTNWGFLRALLVLGLVSVLLLLEPDFGTAVVILGTGLGMLFLGGVALWRLGVLLLPLVLGMGALAWLAPYRMSRLRSFSDPWADPFGSGFQLTQSLIGFGRGEVTGVGLGAGVQKLHYLPEAHTDFLLSVVAEELGLVGTLTVIALFAWLLWRGFAIARRAQLRRQRFAALVAVGVCLWLGLQAFINLGVNMGMLPTKGLTLPLMSYGGSSLLAACVGVALLLRVGMEAPAVERGAGRGERRGGRR